MEQGTNAETLYIGWRTLRWLHKLHGAIYVCEVYKSCGIYYGVYIMDIHMEQGINAETLYIGSRALQWLHRLHCAIYIHDI